MARARARTGAMDERRTLLATPTDVRQGDRRPSPPPAMENPGRCGGPGPPPHPLDYPAATATIPPKAAAMADTTAVATLHHAADAAVLRASSAWR